MQIFRQPKHTVSSESIESRFVADWFLRRTQSNAMRMQPALASNYATTDPTTMTSHGHRCAIKGNLMRERERESGSHRKLLTVGTVPL